MLRLSWADWVIFLAYLGVVFLIGLHFARRQSTTAEYFVGNRRMNWWVIGASIFATSFSSVSFLALPREGAFADYHFFLVILFIPFVITPILWYFFVPFFMRLGITSMYSYLEMRFDRRVRKVGTLLFAAYVVGWMGTMLHAMGLTLQAILGLSDGVFLWMVIGIGLFATLYTLVGGFQAVVWTDLLQGVTIGGSMIIVLLLALQKIDGGFPAVLEIGSANDKFDLFTFTLDLSERQSFLTAVAYGLFMYLPGYTASQVMVQRYISLSSLADARRALLINAVINPIVAMIFFFTGSTLFAFYHQPGAGGFPVLLSQDQLLPYFMAAELAAVGLTGLVVAGLFGAAMSSMDSGINSLTAVAVHDWLPRQAGSIWFSRALTGVFGLGITLAALLMPYLGEYVIEILTKIVGTFLGLLLAVFLLGMLFSHATSRGTLSGLLAGGLCVGVAWTQPAVAHWWYGGIALGVTLLVGAVASRFDGGATAVDVGRKPDVRAVTG